MQMKKTMKPLQEYTHTHTHTHTHTGHLLNKKRVILLNNKLSENNNKIYLNKSAGITIISLIVTIIVLLILAGISIATLTSDNGIIKQSKSAKEKTEISEEKEAIQKAVIGAIGTNKRGNLEESELEKQLDKEFGTDKTTLLDAGEEFDISIKNTNRYYILDKDGNITDSCEIIKDIYPGDITRGKDGEILDGSEEHPYEIWCIEDLIALSNIVNATGIKYVDNKPVELTRTDAFTGKYVKLMRNLNFKSKFSYADSERTDFGNLNGIDNDGDKLINEMKTGTGFPPIGRNYTMVYRFFG